VVNQFAKEYNMKQEWGGAIVGEGGMETLSNQENIRSPE